MDDGNDTSTSSQMKIGGSNSPAASETKSDTIISLSTSDSGEQGNNSNDQGGNNSEKAGIKNAGTGNFKQHGPTKSPTGSGAGGSDGGAGGSPKAQGSSPHSSPRNPQGGVFSPTSGYDQKKHKSDYYMEIGGVKYDRELLSTAGKYIRCTSYVHKPLYKDMYNSVICQPACRFPLHHENEYRL